MDEDKKPRFIQMPNSNLMDKSAIDAAYFKKEVPDSRVIYSKVMEINSSHKSKLAQNAPKSPQSLPASSYRTSYQRRNIREPKRCFQSYKPLFLILYLTVISVKSACLGNTFSTSKDIGGEKIVHNICEKIKQHP